VHPVPDWQEWLGQAVSAGILRRPRALAVLDAITDGTALVREALAGDPVFRLAHRDVSRSNIVVTAGGPVLIDFDRAGPEVPWWEFVHHGFGLASPALGEQPPGRN
jgi:Ser/Thr protein kinase RdoA (MazF antagonist)